MEEFLPDIRKNGMEAVPASHFTNGGIRINESCETNVPGLFAAGEVTGGVHGANRIANNAYTEMVVFGHRSGRFAAEYAKKMSEPAIDPKQVEEAVGRLLKPIEREEGIKPVEIKNRIQKLAWEKVGVIRDGKILEESLREIEETKNLIPKLYATNKDPVYNREWVEALQVENMLLCLEMVARAGIMRTESRGAHYRKDYPNTDYIKWTKNIIVRQVEGKMTFRTEPAIITKLKPPEKVTPYGVTE